MKFLAGRWFLGGVVVGASLLFVVTGGAERKGSIGRLANRAVMGIMLPLETLVSRLDSFLAWDRGGDDASGTLDDSVRRLRRRVVELESENREYAALAEDNKHLRSLLDLAPTLPTPHLIGEVVGLRSSNWFHTAVVNRGQHHGVGEGDVLIDHRGLVGQTLRTFKLSSTVLLLTDRRSGVGARVGSGGTPCIVNGTGEADLILIHSGNDSLIRIGDEVVTSGLGGVYPSGLVIGTVTKIEVRKQGAPMRAVLSPVVDPQDLHEVFIFSNPESGSLP